MSIKPPASAILTVIGGLTILSAFAVDLTWDPPPASDGVQLTLVQAMDLSGTNVLSFTTTNVKTITIPGSASGRRFRAAHSNQFGLSNWTPWIASPGTVTGLRVTVPFTP